MIRTIALPRDINSYGDIFGGWLLSQMDLGGGIAAKETVRGRITTVAIDAEGRPTPIIRIDSDKQSVGL